MFDGSHRSQRRTVNLGTKRRQPKQSSSSSSGNINSNINSNTLYNNNNSHSNTGSNSIHDSAVDTNSKTALLEKTRRLREERRRTVERNAAAVTLQRTYRAGQSRHRTVASWQDELFRWFWAHNQQQKQQTPATATTPNINHAENTTALLNAWLRLTQRQKVSPFTTISLLKNYAAFLSNLLLQQKQNPPPRCNRIVQATLRCCIMATATTTTTTTTTTTDDTVEVLTPQETITILSYTLHLPCSAPLRLATADATTATTLSTAAWTMTTHPSRYYWNRCGDIALLVDTYTTYRRAKQAFRDLDSTSTTLTVYLFFCIQACLPDSIHGRATHCALSLTHPTDAAVDADADGARSSAPVAVALDATGTLHDRSILSLLMVLRQPPSVTATHFRRDKIDCTDPGQENEPEQEVLHNIVQKLVTRNMVGCLQRLLAIRLPTNSSVASVAVRVKFLKMVLLDMVDSSSSMSCSNTGVSRLVWLLNRVVRGDNVFAKAKTESTTVKETTQSAADDEYDSDDEGDEDNALGVGGAKQKLASVSKSSTTCKYMFSKHSLQTLPKLDRLYADLLQKAHLRLGPSSLLHSTSRQSAEQLSVLASTIGDPNVWLLWGNLLLNDTLAADQQAVSNDSDGLDMSFIVHEGRYDFITVLAVLLQATTGLRPQQNATASNVLKGLASSRTFLESLWKFILHEMHTTGAPVGARDMEIDTKQPLVATKTCITFAFSLFCDLFAHRLIALRDEQFLTDHTTTTGVSVAIDAVTVITHLRTLLYGLYWKNPVLAADFKLLFGASDTLISTKAGGRSSDLVISSTFDEDSFAAARARLLLAGTKLWNSLYERWCRLLRHAPFCDEVTWCFPEMISMSMDSDVMTDLNENPFQNRRRVDNDDMDVDEMSLDSDDHFDDDRANTLHTESDNLASAFSHPKLARLLASIPQAMSFDQRVKLFHSLLRADKRKTQDETAEMHRAMLAMMRGTENSEAGREIKIRRDQLYDDSISQLNKLGPRLKRRIHVSFINQHGAEEAGIDGGGVFKEFIHDLIKDAFSVEKVTSGPLLFVATPLQTLAVNSDLFCDQSRLSHYEFLGRVLGKAVYESILVEPQFCLPFLNQLLGKSNSLEDLKNFDPEYHRNLTKLLSLNAADLEGLGLTFELTHGAGKSSRTVELVPSGRTISVTKDTVIQYIHLVSHHRLNAATAYQTRAFLQGFRDLIPASWVRLFSGYELQKVISGDDSVQGIDVASLKQAMLYSAGYHGDQPVIQWFWEIVDEMNVDQQHQFLKFMTSCSRQPLLGFGSLEPAPCVQQIRLPESLYEENDKESVMKMAPLPTSSTCMNLLKLPNYRWKELMRYKLLVAIESGAGFELT